MSEEYRAVYNPVINSRVDKDIYGMQLNGSSIKEIKTKTGVGYERIRKIGRRMRRYKNQKKYDGHQFDLDSPIFLLPLPVRIHNALVRHGCETVKDIIGTLNDTTGVRNFGEGSRVEVIGVLVSLGILNSNDYDLPERCPCCGKLS